MWINLEGEKVLVLITCKMISPSTTNYFKNIVLKQNNKKQKMREQKYCGLP